MSEKSMKADDASKGPQKPEATDKTEKAEKPPTKAAASKSTVARPATPSGGGRLALPALLLAAVALAVSGWLWNQQEQTKLQREALLQEMISQQQALESRLDLLAADLRARGNEIDARQLRLEEADGQRAVIAEELTRAQRELEQGISRLHGEIGRQGDDWRLAEAEHLLRLANHRLRLAADIDVAIAALEHADTTLQQLGDPAYAAVRAEVARELTALRGVDRPDIEGIAHQLAALAERARKLAMPLHEPIYHAGHPATPGEEGDGAAWQRYAAALWAEMRSLVTIRHQDQNDRALLPPEHEWYLQQNIALRLEQARLALLRGETQLFHDSIREARTWSARWFDAEDAVTRDQLDALDQLLQRRIEVELPDISGSLRLLRQQRGGTVR